MEKPPAHVMLVTFAAQGLINPLLQLAKALASSGLLVTFAATESAGKRMRDISDTSNNGGFLQFRFFSDILALDGDLGNVDTYLVRLKAVGPASLTQLLQDLEATTPVSCIISNPFAAWVVDVAGKLNIPCALFWPQPYAVFAIYYRHFCNQTVLPSEPMDGDHKMGFPGLPTLTFRDLPTYLLPTNPYSGLNEALAETFCSLNNVKWILVNSFQDLEKEVISSNSDLPAVKMAGPFTRVRGGVPGDLSGDMWHAAECLNWLNTQPASTVVYVSFGSYVAQSPEQMVEIAWGLRRSGQPFIWVVKPTENATDTGVWGLLEELTRQGEVQGMIVQWAPQAEVLLHPSIGCFMSHCGWNSSLESIMAGVPVVAFPDRGDQTTNAMLLAEVYRMGVVVQRGPGGLVGREEVERCIHKAMHGPRREEMKGNALRWREAGRGAASEGGPSAKILQAFVEEMKGLMNDA